MVPHCGWRMVCIAAQGLRRPHRIDPGVGWCSIGKRAARTRTCQTSEGSGARWRGSPSRLPSRSSSPRCRPPPSGARVEGEGERVTQGCGGAGAECGGGHHGLSLIHISEPTRPRLI
eukprot:3119304-Rhodomonas_salina.1